MSKVDSVSSRRLYTGIFNDSYPPILDGVTLTVENYVRWLSASGESPCVVTPWNPLNVKTDCKTLKYFSLPITSRKPYRYGYPLADPAIWVRLMRTPFRIIHSHCPFSSGRLAVFASRRQRVPLVATFHSKYRDDLIHSFTTLPWMTDLIMQKILNFFNACDHVWIPQAKVAETVREYGYKGELTVVENGNDFADILQGNPRQYKLEARRRCGISDGTLSLLFVGQHIWEKGNDTILKSLGLIKDSVDFRMNYIGTGYALDDMKKLAVDLGISDRVTFHGVVNSREKLADFFAAADLFLFPSPYDNAPLVVREAAAMHTPSILLKGSTAAEVVVDRQNGFLAGRDVADFADYIRFLASNRGLLADVGDGAAKMLVRSWKDVVEEVERRYSDIIRTYASTNKYK